MLAWLLPTFLWTGKALDENDRPFENLKLPLSRVAYEPYPNIHSPVGNSNISNGDPYRKRIQKPRSTSLSKRISNAIHTVTTTTSFSKIYNRLFCPQCLARIGLINGVLVSLSGQSLPI